VYLSRYHLSCRRGLPTSSRPLVSLELVYGRLESTVYEEVRIVDGCVVSYSPGPLSGLTSCSHYKLLSQLWTCSYYRLLSQLWTSGRMVRICPSCMIKVQRLMSMFGLKTSVNIYIYSSKNSVEAYIKQHNEELVTQSSYTNNSRNLGVCFLFVRFSRKVQSEPQFSVCRLVHMFVYSSNGCFSS
jgi:hypothetical protein